MVTLTMDALAIAHKLVEQLEQRKSRIVFAESCTCGLAAATMGQISGVSNFFCGSAVTYRIPTKMAWLEIPESEIQQHTAESQVTSDWMAKQVLQRTPEADLSAAITGHLGPGAGPAVDGFVFVSVLDRRTDLLTQKEFRLLTKDRKSRQIEATKCLMSTALECCS